MSGYAGDIRLGKTIDLKFTTRQSSGVPTTLAGTPAISAYPDNSTTQLTAGITLTVDFDGVTGYNNVRVAATGGNGYETVTNYDLSITTGTVNSVSVVGESIGSFSIENRSALMPVTADRTLVVDAAGLADANTVKVGPTAAGTAQTALDISANVTTLVNRLGAFTGSGINTVLGFLRAIMSKAAALTPSDVGGTFDNTTDSIEAVRDRGDAAWGTAVGFSTHSAADVWAVGTRTLTGAANITSTGGTVPITGDGLISCDVKRMNATVVLGTGTAGDLWRG